MSEDSSQEKTEEPTERKLTKSREDGQVPRSRELGTAVLLVSSAVTLLIFGSWLSDAVITIAKFNFSFEREAAIDPSYMFKHMARSGAEAAVAVAPILLIGFVAGVIGTIGLGGFNFTTKAIAFKANKLNPFSGLKRMFSANSLVELGKGWLKILLIGGVSIGVMNIYKDEYFQLAFEDINQAMVHAVDLLLWPILFICLSTIVIALIDVPWQQHSHTKKLKMTFQEIKEEFKNSEGKPEVKARIRQLQREMSQNRMMSDVPDADVVITNPEHYSVALKYDHETMATPIMLAKGVDQIAFKIREIANEHKIPIIQAPPLARSIYHNTEIGDEIPEGLYIAIAQVLGYVYQMEQWRKGFGEQPNQGPDYPIPDDLRADE
jgi:flagellar biosynthesis protein FlhB